MSEFPVAFAVLSLGSAAVTVIGGVLAWLRFGPELKSLRAQTRKTEIESAISGEAAEDAHWQTILKAQAEAIVAPLRAEVEELRGEVRTLRAEVETHRARYWRAITYIRVLHAWARHPSTTDIPSPPAELAVDI